MQYRRVPASKQNKEGFGFESSNRGCDQRRDCVGCRLVEWLSLSQKCDGKQNWPYGSVCAESSERRDEEGGRQKEGSRPRGKRRNH